jgi:hypothetical protein
MSTCDHQWRAHGTLQSGDNPQIEIEACILCGVQRKTSFEIHEEPQVHGSAVQQVLLQIEHLKRTVKSPHDLVEHVIQLYGAEFVKANEHIAALDASLKASGELLTEQKRVNDELFRIKQRVVIANRELIQKNSELAARLATLPAITNTLREAHARVQNEIAITASDNSGFARDLAALCDFIELYDKATAKPPDTPA